jgi:UDP-GlcNAc:undecaprenyl-phosphate GlcNAc-1-phosphate transferase
MIGIFVVVFFSFVLSLAAVASILHLSHKKSWYDQIDERKIHTGDIPRLGGLGFASAFIIIAFFINFSAPESYFRFRFLPPLLALILILVSGVVDDFRPLTPRYKLLIQFIAALCVIIPGYTFRRVFFSILGEFSVLNWIRYPLSFLWIVGLTNAINLIDGVDGLAGGISALAALTFALIFVSFAGTETAVIFCLGLAAVICGFLVFNAPLPKARIFMGDGGSQFLGFILAILPFTGDGSASNDLPLSYAAVILLIPILDTLAAIWRRVRDGRRIDSPDKLHIHHKLMNLGLKARGVDGILYTLQIILGGLAFLAVKYKGVPSLVLLGTAYITGISFFSAIHFMNRSAAKRQAQ